MHRRGGKREFSSCVHMRRIRRVKLEKASGSLGGQAVTFSSCVCTVQRAGGTVAECKARQRFSDTKQDAGTLLPAPLPSRLAERENLKDLTSQGKKMGIRAHQGRRIPDFPGCDPQGRTFGETCRSEEQRGLCPESEDLRKKIFKP